MLLTPYKPSWLRGDSYSTLLKKERGREGTSPGWRMTHSTNFLERGFTTLVVAEYSG